MAAKAADGGGGVCAANAGFELQMARGRGPKECPEGKADLEDKTERKHPPKITRVLQRRKVNLKEAEETDGISCEKVSEKKKRTKMAAWEKAHWHHCFN